jgi:glycosyltransferase involved in cell wall biosynthesis
MHDAPSFVSVIIPFFNEERFLQEAIQSVLQQTYTHWEILLIDDGSWDNSTTIANEYATRYPDKVFYIEHPGHLNKGLSATRNAGIAKARGNLLALLDADDVWLPEKLEKQVAVFQHNPAVALLCESSLYWYSWHSDALNDIEIPIGAPNNKAYAPPQLSLQLYPLGEGAAPCPSGLMLKTEVVKKHGGFEEGFTGLNQMYEDQPFLAKFYLNEIVYISSGCHNKYRQRHGSLVHKVKVSGQYDDVRFFFLQWLQRYLDQNNIRNNAIRLALAKALRKYKYPRLHKLAGFIKRKLGPPTPHGDLKKL